MAELALVSFFLRSSPEHLPSTFTIRIDDFRPVIKPRRAQLRCSPGVYRRALGFENAKALRSLSRAMASLLVSMNNVLIRREGRTLF